MQKDNGWIKLHRVLLEKPIWKGSTSEQKVILVTLLMMASHRGKEWEWNCKKFKIKPGQFVTSLQKIAQKAGGGISVKNVRTAIHRFEKFGFLANQSTNHGRLITIINWDTYQLENTLPGKATGKGGAKGGHMSGNYQECKEGKNDKKDSNYLVHFELFWNAFADKQSKKSARKSWNQIPDLNEELCKKIIEGAKRYAIERKNILARGSTPKMAQGWLTDQRWEDEIIPQPPKPSTEMAKRDQLFRAYREDEARLQDEKSDDSGHTDVAKAQDSPETTNPAIGTLSGERTDSRGSGFNSS